MFKTKQSKHADLQPYCIANICDWQNLCISTPQICLEEAEEQKWAALLLFMYGMCFAW